MELMVESKWQWCLIRDDEKGEKDLKGKFSTNLTCQDI